MKWDKNKIKLVLEHTGLTAQQLANLCEYDRSNLSKLLQGQFQVSKQLEQKLNEVFAEITNEEKILQSIRELKEKLGEE